MNFYPKDKDYRDSPAAAAIVAEHFGDAEALGAEEHEFKAFQEFLDSTGKRAVYLAYNQCFEQAVAQIV
jgi:hypothetical protein